MQIFQGNWDSGVGDHPLCCLTEIRCVERACAYSPGKRPHSVIFSSVPKDGDIQEWLETIHKVTS